MKEKMGKKKLKQIMIGYVIKYLIGFLIIYISALLISQAARQEIETYVAELTEKQEKAGIEIVDQAIAKMDLIGTILNQNQAMGQLISCRGNLQKEKALQLREANAGLKSVGYLADFSPYMFCIFKENDLYLSSNQCSYWFSDYYGKFLEIGLPDRTIEDAQECRTFLLDELNAGNHFIKTSFVRCWPEEETETVYSNAVLYLNSTELLIGHAAYVLGFVISEDYLTQNLMLPDVEENGNLWIENQKNKEVLFVSDTAASAAMPEMFEDGRDIQRENGYWYIRKTDEKLGWIVTVGIPESYMEQKIVSVYRLLTGYLLIGLAAVVILTCVFSMRQYRNLQKILSSFPAGELQMPENRFLTEELLLTDNIRNLRERGADYHRQVEELKRQNQAILLENLMVLGIRTPQEKRAFEVYFDRMPEFYCVAIAEFQTEIPERFEEIAVAMRLHLQKQGTAVLANVRNGMFYELFLIELKPEETSDMSRIAEQFEKTAAEMTANYQITFHIGISTVGTKLENISRCYAQAQQIVRAQYSFENENAVCAYDISMDAGMENPLTVELMNRLTGMILCGEEEKIMSELSKIEDVYKRKPYLFESCRAQIFFTLRSIIQSAAHQLNYPWEDARILIYREDETSGDMMENFRSCARSICRFMEEGKRSKNEKLKETILTIMQRSYADPGLSAAMVSAEAGIAEKYLYQYLKEQTGETFVSILMRLRIEQARKYLEESDFSNEKIAELTGFGSVNSFYRNFGKYVGVTPKVYREQKK